LSRKWSELREHIDASSPRPPLSAQDHRKPRSKRFLTTQDIADIKHRYEAAQTTQQIATHYGISKTRVATVLREQGVTIRRQGLTDEQLTEAAKLYAEGDSLLSVGAHFGVSQTTIATALRRQGVHLRPRPGWR
jgi:AraC-like DNA-binding protein